MDLNSSWRRLKAHTHIEAFVVGKRLLLLAAFQFDEEFGGTEIGQRMDESKAHPEAACQAAESFLVLVEVDVETCGIRPIWHSPEQRCKRMSQVYLVPC